MKVILLAGGWGSRLAEETSIRPKPLVEIGGKPILWHILKHYAFFGYTEFFIALGYKGEMVKRFFVDYNKFGADITIDFKKKNLTRKNDVDLDWTVHLVDTGIKTQTGGRIKRLEKSLNDGPFMLTYGDGVSDIDLDRLLEFHQSHGKMVTMTAVRPPARYGHLVFNGDHVVEFSEKPQTESGWINGGFFILEPEIFKYIRDDHCKWEYEPLEMIAKEGELMAYRHDGFWQCMDTLREKQILESLWKSGEAPWKTSNLIKR